VRRPVIPPVLILSAATAVVLLPLATELVGLAGVIVTIAGMCSVLVLTTILTRRAGRTERLADLGV
jgi:hypothetical protein